MKNHDTSIIDMVDDVGPARWAIARHGPLAIVSAAMTADSTGTR
jgi:hypothetical protein